MCEHCGCRQIEPIAELMDEHLRLLDLGGEVTRHLAAGDRPAAWTVLATLAHALSHHVDREEHGVFRALKDQESLGIFPIATIALGAGGWDTVATAHERVSATSAIDAAGAAGAA